MTRGLQKSFMGIAACERLYLYFFGLVILTVLSTFSYFIYGVNDSILRSRNDLALIRKILEKKSTNLTRPDTSVVFNKINNDIKLIVMWNTYHGQYINPMEFMGNCYNRCRITHNRDWVYNADAVIFYPHYAVDFQWNRLPLLRTPHQRYIAWLREPPTRQTINIGYVPNFFNWTASYRRNSDVWIPVGQTLKRAISTPLPSNLTEIVKQKSKLVAWWVRNCNSTNQRMNYVEELQKYIQVDIYGPCGNFECDGSGLSNWTECSSDLQTNYKFYLSLENRQCNDYLTEKLWTKLEYFVVPIVVDRNNYDRHVPPNSVIAFDDFDSPEQLAKYLIRLDQNDAEYIKYFNWKTDYEIQSPKMTQIWRHPFNFCPICDKLWNDDSVKSIYDINKWWHHNQCDLDFIVNLLKRANISISLVKPDPNH